MATAGNISNINLPDGNKYDIRATAIPYGTVDSTSTATAFTATVPGITALTDGTVVLLKNSVVTSASGFTININGLGAKPAYSNMATGNPVTPTSPTRETTIFNINYTMLFLYSSTIVDGGGWICYRGYDNNTNTIGYQLRTNSQSLPMKSITYRYRLLFTSADGKHYVPANNSTSTNATASRTVCQDKIDPFGAIYYYGTTASVAAGSRPAAANLWSQYTLSLGYSFNRTGAALVLTTYTPVYVKCAPQTDGSAIIDSTTPYVQTLPTTDDGKIYIFLGIAYSATNIELVPEHPIYYYKDGAIRLWTNQLNSGSTVSVTQKTSSGTNIADITVNGTTTQLYAPDEVFLVNVTLTDTVSGTSDKTSEEIYNAAIAGLMPVVKANMGSTYMVAPLSLVGPDIDFADIYHAVFTYEDQSNVAYKYCTMTITGTAVTLVYKDGYVTSSEISNYIPVKDVTVDGNSIVDGNDDYAKLVTSTTNPYNALTNPLATMGDISSAGGGTVTSITAGSGLTAVGSGGEPLPYADTIVESGTIKLATAYGDTVNPYGKKSATYVLAGPSSGASAVPSFRKLNTSELNNDAGFVTTDTNTTYSISGSVNSHAAGTAFGFATILTAGGSGSGSTSTEVTFAPGSNITITNPSSNTIMISATGGASPNDGKLKLQKDSGTASDVFSANQSGDTTVKFTTAAIYHASTSTAFNQGTLPTISTTKIAADDITSWTTNTPTAINTTKFSGGSFTRGTFTGGSFTQGTDSFTAATHGNDSFTANAPTSITFSNSGGTSSASAGMLIVSVTAGTSAAFTQGTFSGGSFTQGNDSFTAATHAADSFTAASLQTGFYTAGTAASLSYTAREIPNVTSAGTLPTLSLTSTTVVTNISKV